MRYHRDENEHFIFNVKNHFSIEHKTWCTSYLDYSSLILFGFLHFAYSQVQLPFFFFGRVTPNWINGAEEKVRYCGYLQHNTVGSMAVSFFFFFAWQSTAGPKAKNKKIPILFFFKVFVFIVLLYLCWLLILCFPSRVQISFSSFSFPLIFPMKWNKRTRELKRTETFIQMTLASYTLKPRVRSR